MSTVAAQLSFQTEERRLLNRALSVVTDLRAGEAATALLLTANIFVVLASYYVLKTVREALILSEAGAEVKSYSAAAQALLLLAVIPAYSFLASKATRSRLITWVTLFFVSNLAVFYFLGKAGYQVGVAFFLWVGIFNVLVIAQFWAFANDVYDSESGKRIFPIIGIGSSLGAWIGAVIAAQLFTVLSAYELMLVAAGGLLVSLILVRRVDTKRQNQVESAEKSPSRKGGFGLVLSNRYLLLIAMMVLTFNLVNSLGEYILGQMVVADAAAAVEAGVIDSSEMRMRIGAFYGDFFGWVNLFGLLLQVIVVSRLFKYAGVRGALFVLPLIALGSYSLMAVLPILGVVKIAKILENSSDYSIQNTARHALFLPTSREEKYKAKAAIDTFFWRVGDMLQAGFVLAGTWLAFTTRQYAWMNIALVAVWLVLIIGIYREHRKLVNS
jgi:AAA family ATP:ADP antiporter